MSGIYLDTDDSIYRTVSKEGKMYLYEEFLDPFISYSNIKKSKIAKLDNIEKEDIDPRMD